MRTKVRCWAIDTARKLVNKKPKGSEKDPHFASRKQSLHKAGTSIVDTNQNFPRLVQFSFSCLQNVQTLRADNSQVSVILSVMGKNVQLGSKQDFIF